MSELRGTTIPSDWLALGDVLVEDPEACYFPSGSPPWLLPVAKDRGTEYRRTG